MPTVFVFGQTLEAHYKVTKEMYATIANGEQKHLATLQYDGFFYHQVGRNIFFKKPLYLQQYPNGYIVVSSDGSNTVSIGLVMDTIQGISYIDTDSLVDRQRVDIGGTFSFNAKQKLKIGRVNWQLLPDKKTVNGLNCQKAQWTVNGTLQWVVWFCADIPVFVGPGCVTDVPGLVVEAENEVTNEKYVLESYNSNAAIDKTVFWPKEFDQPFK